MYKKLSQILTRYYIEHQVIDSHEEAVYKYCFEILIATVFYTAIFILLALITRTLLASFVFFVAFFTIRTFAGGYHTSSYFSCHILSTLNHLVLILLLRICPFYIYENVSFFLNILSAVIVFIFAPVDHPSKKFIKNEEQRFRILSRIYSVLLFVLTIIYWTFSLEFDYYLFSFSIGTFSASSALMSAKIKKVKEQKQYEKFFCKTRSSSSQDCS